VRQNKNYTIIGIKGDQIEIMVEGISVVGRITLRDRRNIAVEIINPFSGISEQSGCIPLLGLQVHNFLGKAGEERAASLLCTLYCFCRFVDEHKERLLEALHNYKYKVAYAKHFSQEARELAQRRTTTLENLLAIRKELKEGKIDNIQYQRRIKPLNKVMKLLSKEKEIDLDAIFDECFNHFWNTPVWELSRETVLNYLEVIIKTK